MKFEIITSAAGAARAARRRPPESACRADTRCRGTAPPSPGSAARRRRRPRPGEQPGRGAGEREPRRRQALHRPQRGDEDGQRQQRDVERAGSPGLAEYERLRARRRGEPQHDQRASSHIASTGADHRQRHAPKRHAGARQPRASATSAGDRDAGRERRALSRTSAVASASARSGRTPSSIAISSVATERAPAQRRRVAPRGRMRLDRLRAGREHRDQFIGLHGSPRIIAASAFRPRCTPTLTADSDMPGAPRRLGHRQPFQLHVDDRQALPVRAGAPAAWRGRAAHRAPRCRTRRTHPARRPADRSAPRAPTRRRSRSTSL